MCSGVWHDKQVLQKPAMVKHVLRDSKHSLLPSTQRQCYLFFWKTQACVQT